MEDFDSNINNIEILTEEEVNDLLVKDEDGYYKTFFPLDLQMRGVNTVNEYIDLIQYSGVDANNIQKMKLRKCINQANEKLSKIKLEWFDGQRAANIPWKIGLIQDKVYENGLPHTRNDVILISKKNVDGYTSEKLIKTLIHEKVHIYQKKYRRDVLRFLKEYGFTALKTRSEEDKIRANPDLDNIVYMDGNNIIYKATYLENGKTIEDVVYTPKNNQSHEHPFEKMAIYIENESYNKA